MPTALLATESLANPKERCTASQDQVGAQTLYIKPGSPRENGYIESFNGKQRGELLEREVFYTLLEVKVLTEQYRRTYNRIRPHSSLGYRPPAPETVPPSDPVLSLAGLT